MCRMKKMKKARIVLCASVMALGMVGCAGQTENETQDTVTQEEVAENQATEEVLQEEVQGETQEEIQDEAQEEVKEAAQEETQTDISESIQEDTKEENAIEKENAIEENTEGESANITSTDEKTLLIKVLKGEEPFVYTKDGGKEITISQLAYNEENPYEPIQYAIVDMDGDGKSEVVVELSSAIDGAYEVFHVIGEKVYGYETVFRAMSKLYEGGYCMGANGASSWDIYQMSFSESGYTTNNVAGCVDGTYYLKGVDNVAAEEYQKFVDENLEVVTWYDMSTVEEKISQMATTVSTKQMAANKKEENTVVEASGKKVIADSKVSSCALQKNPDVVIQNGINNE